MNRLAKHLSLGFAWLLAIAGAASAAEPVRIAIVGDSTVCDYPANKPERGWGMFIEGYFRPGAVKVLNLAKSGRSSKSFITEGLWDKTRAAKPDFVLIQFGHNDSHAKTEPKATDANGDFKDYVRRYINESRAIRATPILVTPMHRRTFGADGKLTDTLQPYASAMKEVAAEKKAALIDLHASSGRLFLKLGAKGSKDLDSKPGDQTHFNERGAKAMAELVIKELPGAEPRLKKLLK
jgi:lysophospholipase L1-like esterase